MSIAQRVVKVSAVTWLSTVLSMGMQLVSVPVCLHFWGRGTYGVWLALFAAFTMMRTIDGGYVTYVGNKINILYHRDQSQLKITLASAVYGVLLLGGLQLLVLVILYFTHSMGIIMDTNESDISVLNIFIALVILSISWISTGSYIGIVHRLQIPAGMMYQAAWWSMGFQVTQFIGLMISAVLKLNILGAAFVYALFQALIYISSAIYIKIKLPVFYPWWNGANKEVGLTNLIKSIPITAGGILQQGGGSALVMLVSGFLSPAVVPLYSTVRTLGNLWTTLINILTSALLPEVVRFHALKDREKILAVQKAHLLVMSATVNFSVLMFYPFIEYIFGIWTRHSLSLNKPLLDMLLATVPIIGIGALVNVYLSGINHYLFIISTSAIRGGGGVVISFILLSHFGLYGIGWALFLSELLVLGITLNWFYRQIRIKFKFLYWEWISGLSVIGYMIFASLNYHNSHMYYFLAIVGVVIGTIISWIKLDINVKSRLASLIHRSEDA